MQHEQREDVAAADLAAEDVRGAPAAASLALARRASSAALVASATASETGFAGRLRSSATAASLRRYLLGKRGARRR